MKLNNYDFGTDFQAMMNRALSIAKDAGKLYGIDFKGIAADSISISLEKGQLSHIWIHTQHDGRMVRCAITGTGHALYAWEDKRGWVTYTPAPVQKSEPKKPSKMTYGTGYFDTTGHRVFCTTLGWDGKDYEGKGRSFPEWTFFSKYGSRFDGRSFIRIYDRSHKCYCFLEVTERRSDNNIRIADYACCLD
ncbi:MAG: hypothetical protein IJQ79_02050 [Bacteroidales bacterium]|nr:hypothetical protein [Bacteroidales bacterium]